MQDTAPAPLFIVSVDEILVACDIELSIAELHPSARIIVARTLDEVADLLPEAGRVEAAFVQSDAQRFLASRLGQRLAADGGRLVLVGQDTASATMALCLPQPFSHMDVEAALMPE